MIMARIQPIDVQQAQGKVKTLLEGVKKSLGIIPNMMRTMAVSPAVLDAYLAFGQALHGASLDAKTQEAVALTVAGANGCNYCASAHTAIGGMLNLDSVELSQNLRGRSRDTGLEAALRFARAIVDKRGSVSDEDVAQLRKAGYGEAAIAEIVAVVAVNLFTNYFNQAIQTDIDFPVVKAA
jgi:uncharacterized peroxidase-related enzyme